MFHHHCGIGVFSSQKLLAIAEAEPVGNLPIGMLLLRCELLDGENCVIGRSPDETSGFGRAAIRGVIVSSSASVFGALAIGLTACGATQTGQFALQDKCSYKRVDDDRWPSRRSS